METMVNQERGTWNFNAEHQGLQVLFLGKPASEIIAGLKKYGFRWSGRQRLWYAKDAAFRREFLNTVADCEGTVGEKLSFSERMARKVERAEARIERYEAKATRLKLEGRIKLKRGDEMASYIPMGQPILVGHHSEKRHRRTLDRIHTLTRNGLADLRASEGALDRSNAAKSTLRGFEDPSKIQRRIKRLEAEIRKFERAKADCEYAQYHGRDKYGYEVSAERAARGIQRYINLIAESTEQLDYWKAQLEESGAKVWGPKDFSKGMRIKGSHGAATIKRVNPMSLTVDYDVAVSLGTLFQNVKLPYDKVKGILS